LHYNQKDIEDSLIRVGIRKGDIIFSHMNLGFFGIPEGGMSEDNLFEIFYKAIFNVLGEKGVLIVPTFSYTFASKGQKFDIDNTPSKMGFFAEKIRKLSNSARTNDPMFSVAMSGNIKKIFPDKVSVSSQCFGDNSIWDLMYKNNAKICNFNVDSGSTYIHYVEKKHNVPYRFDKLFSGVVTNGEKEYSSEVLFFCRKLKYLPNFTKFDYYVKSNAIAKVAKLGRGSLVSISCKDTSKVFAKLYKNDRMIMVSRA